MNAEDKDTVLEIKEYLVSMLYDRYGYCGVSYGEESVMINSGNENIVIQIKCE